MKREKTKIYLDTNVYNRPFLEMLRTHHHKNLTGSVLREAGWNTLVKNLGILNATRFILQYESGYGDYTEIRKEIFKGKTVNDLCREIEKLEKVAVK
ncbi:MAG: hypothetical protein HZA08_08205 [Nitrospirae bacterium]|nr:hypothetical protein [Nitrospirota bacterium]